MATKKSKPQADNLKQKSIVSWFGQPNSGNSSNTKSATSKPTTQKVASELSPNARQGPGTPHTKTQKTRPLNSPSALSSKSSDAGISVMETPPTSDPVDVDMMSVEEEEESVTGVKLVSSFFLKLSLSLANTTGWQNNKSRVVFPFRVQVDNSFFIIMRVRVFIFDLLFIRQSASVKLCWTIPTIWPKPTSYRLRKSMRHIDRLRRHWSRKQFREVNFYLLRVLDVLVIFSAPGRGKKARVAVLLSDDDEEESANVTAFSKRLTQYKKVPSSAFLHELPIIRSNK
jgi:hypothetical protein